MRCRCLTPTPCRFVFVRQAGHDGWDALNSFVRGRVVAQCLERCLDAALTLALISSLFFLYITKMSLLLFHTFQKNQSLRNK